MSPLLQSQIDEEEEKPIQMKQMVPEAENSHDITEQSIQIGSGKPLEPETKNFMESRFGYDFGEVRIHADPNAERLSARLGAEAFTVGRNVYFGSGKYNPITNSGRRLLAHELTHVVQQNKSCAPKIQFLCSDHSEESYYQSNPNFCRDTESSGSQHPNHRCYREIPTGSGCPSGEHVCFRRDNGQCDSSETHVDSTAPTLSREANGVCDLSWFGGCTLVHGVLDLVPHILAQAQQRQMECIRNCETLPWYLKGFCMQGCSPGPMR